MPKWVWRRIGFSLLVLCAALIINFILPRLMPTNIEDIYAGGSSLTAEARKAILERFGLDKPIMTQFWIYIRNTFTGAWGTSFYYYPRTVSSLIWERLPRSLGLLIPAEIIYVLIGYYLGVKSGWKAGSKTDSAITGIFLAFWSAPIFWVSMIVLFIFGYKLDWFPMRGYRTVGSHYTYFAYIWDLLRHAIMPIFSMVLCRIGTSQLLMRNTLTITLKENYITTARAKGMSENRVKYRHASRNALLPLVTSTGMGMAMAVSGSVFVETIFSYQGVGRLIFDSVIQQDYPVIQGCFFILTIVVIAMVFLLDFLYTRLDPRVRF
ncbi:MAG: ABC transporter permease [Chloroflexi bacterium]|nr:ABC transporter permease [Chloroflexota bacterium]